MSGKSIVTQIDEISEKRAAINALFSGFENPEDIQKENLIKFKLGKVIDKFTIQKNILLSIQKIECLTRSRRFDSYQPVVEQKYHILGQKK